MNDQQEYDFEIAKFETEIRCLRENGSSQLHKYFVDQLESLEGMIIDIEENVVKMPYVHMHDLSVKMIYSYSVTLLEA